MCLELLNKNINSLILAHVFDVNAEIRYWGEKNPDISTLTEESSPVFAKWKSPFFFCLSQQYNNQCVVII